MNNLLIDILLFYFLLWVYTKIDLYLLERHLWKEELKRNPPHPLGRNILLEQAVADAKAVRATSLIQAKLAQEKTEKHL
jgi:hypothetical protein